MSNNICYACVTNKVLFFLFTELHKYDTRNSMTPNSKRPRCCLGKCTPHSNSDYPGVIQRKSILACSGEVAATTEFKGRRSARSLSKEPAVAIDDGFLAHTRQDERGFHCDFASEFVEYLGVLGPEQRVLISSLGWPSVFAYERSLCPLLSLHIYTLLSFRSFSLHPFFFHRAHFFNCQCLFVSSPLFFLSSLEHLSSHVLLLPIFHFPALAPIPFPFFIAKFSFSPVFPIAASSSNFTISYL